MIELFIDGYRLDLTSRMSSHFDSNPSARHDRSQKAIQVIQVCVTITAVFKSVARQHPTRREPHISVWLFPASRVVQGASRKRDIIYSSTRESPSKSILAGVQMKWLKESYNYWLAWFSDWYQKRPIWRLSTRMVRCTPHLRNEEPVGTERVPRHRPVSVRVCMQSRKSWTKTDKE